MKTLKWIIAIALGMANLSSAHAQKEKSVPGMDQMILNVLRTIDEGESLRKFNRFKDTMHMCLDIINRYAGEKTIKEAHYNGLKTSYSNMKSLYDAYLMKLRADMKSLATSGLNTKGLEDGIQNWLNNLEYGYSQIYRNIESEYKGKFFPLMDSVRMNSGAKFLPVWIISGLEYIVANYPEIKRLVNEFLINRSNAKKRILLQLANRLSDSVCVRLTRKFELPSWDAKVRSFAGYTPLVPSAANQILPPGIPPFFTDGVVEENAPAFRVLRTREYNQGFSAMLARNGVDTISVIRNGLLELYPGKGLVNTLVGDYNGSASYTLRSHIGFSPQAENFPAEYGHAFVFHAISPESGINAAPERGVFVTLAEGGRTGYLLLLGALSVQRRMNEIGAAEVRTRLETLQRIEMHDYTPGRFVDLTISVAPGFCTVTVGNQSPVRFDNPLFSEVRGKLYYISYNGTGAVQHSQRRPAKLFVDYVKLNTVSDAGNEDLSPRAIASQRSRFHVICIGISDYDEASLRLNFAEKDARSMNKVYSDSRSRFNFPISTYLITNKEATRKGIIDTLRKVMRLAGRNDVLLIYYSGHGDKGGIIPVDYRLNDETTMLPYDDLVRVLNLKPLKVKGLILDACYSGSAGSSLTARSAGFDQLPGDRLQELLAGVKDGQVFGICSSSESQVSFESDEMQHGVFTYYMLAALQRADFNRSGFVSYGELYHFVKYYMENNATRYNQVLTPIGALQYRMPVIAVR
jgi:hypothetical protein